MPTFLAETELPASAADAYAWHRRPGAFERLAPPWQDVRVLARTGGIDPGDRVKLDVGPGPIPVHWEIEHALVDGPLGFADEQVDGPFRSWRHDHVFRQHDERSCTLEDRIAFELPGGAAVSWIGAPLVRGQLRRLFRFRHRRTADDLAAHRRYSPAGPRRVLVSGASGLVGSALVSFLSTGGHETGRMVRRESDRAEDTVLWSTNEGIRDPERAEGWDAVVHLAGENLAGGRWTKGRKKRIWNSRVDGTRRLAESLAKLSDPPEVLVSASAVGYFGDRGNEPLDETAAPGSGFLADVCRAWEEATLPAREAGIRVVCMRFGVVLAGAGGALAKMLPAFRLGLAGPLGDGRQYFPWISLDDVITACLHAIATPSLDGPVNTVSGAVTNEQYTRTLARVLRRPAFIRAPAGALRFVLGELAEEALLAGQNVIPARLLESGFAFRFDSLEEALRHELGRAP